jgi:hypothetical protein
MHSIGIDVEHDPSMTRIRLIRIHNTAIIGRTKIRIRYKIPVCKKMTKQSPIQRRTCGSY